MTEDEQKELEELRAFKRSHSSLERAFSRLHDALIYPYSVGVDTVMSVKAFKLVAECLIELKRRIDDE